VIELGPGPPPGGGGVFGPVRKTWPKLLLRQTFCTRAMATRRFPTGFQAEIENSVIMPVAKWGMWWQCSIQRAASPASRATLTIDIGGT